MISKPWSSIAEYDMSNIFNLTNVGKYVTKSSEMWYLQRHSFFKC